MNTKHKPATALPHVAGKYAHGIEAVQIQTLELVAQFQREDDAIYYVHTANAYPELVENQKRLTEQMRELQAWAQECRQSGHKISADALWSKLNGIVWNAALLAKLGEAKP